MSPQAADGFIDHPTDGWVRNNLPDELRTVAYLLPADCADVAIVLRHVWLFSQGRTEQYTSGGRTWTVGVQAGETARQRQNRIFDLIVSQVYSANVEAMVNPYADASGNRVRSFAALDPLLHVSDVLVWSHHSGTSQTGARTGGHTQTIETLARDNSGQITSMTLLQGNQPIFAAGAQEIIQSGQTTASESQLRNAPGRRIERDTITRGTSTQDENDIWTQHDAGPPAETTILEVAGPPMAAQRPRAAGRTRALTDRVRRLQSAGASDLQGNFEAALQEARATIEGGGTVSDADAPGGVALEAVRAGGERFGHQSARRHVQRDGPVDAGQQQRTVGGADAQEEPAPTRDVDGDRRRRDGQRQCGRAAHRRPRQGDLRAAPPFELMDARRQLQRSRRGAQ